MTQSNFSYLILIGLVSYVASTCDFSTAYCRASGISCPSTGNTITVNGQTYYLTDIDVISFNDLTINNGDIQKRVAVRNDFYAINGVSVGDMLTDNCGFGLVVGGDLVWNQDGAVFPNNQSFFVGGRVSGPSYLNGQIVSCSTFGQSSGCINSFFDQLFTYWSQFSNSISSVTDNVQVALTQEGIATLTCSGSASLYSARIPSSIFNQIVGYTTVGCDASSEWIINLSGDVTFGGNPIRVSGSVLYNILGSGRVTITADVVGSIVAPSSDIYMVGGTIYGQVIAGNFSNVVQINFPSTCPAGQIASRDVYSCTGASNTGVIPTPSTTGDQVIIPTPSTTGEEVIIVPSTTGVFVSDTGSAIDQPGTDNNGQDNGVSSLAASIFVSMIALAFI